MAENTAPDERELGVKTPPAGDADLPFVRRLAAAMAETNRVAKDGRNTEQNYDYTSVEAMLDEVRGPLLKRGIILIPNLDTYETATIRSSRGTEGTSAVVTVTFTFIDGDTGATLERTWKGQGQDYGDKAIGKAYTNAIKTFVRTAWLLPTGDDPEADSPERVPKANGDSKPKLPAWATRASDARRVELGGYLVPLVGRDAAREIVAAVQGSIGHFPDGFVAFAKLVDSKVLERDPRELADALADRAATVENAQATDGAAAAQAAAEDPDPPPADPDPPPEGRPAAADGPPPGTVDPPEMADDLEPDAKRRKLRAAGCTCKDPVPDDDAEHDAGCPILGHGIPF